MVFFLKIDLLYFLDKTSLPNGTDDYNKTLFPKYDQISKEFIAEVKKADVITLGFNDLDFAFAQMKRAATASPYFAIDWDRILNEDGVKAVEELLAYQASLQADVQTRTQGLSEREAHNNAMAQEIDSIRQVMGRR